MDFGSPGVAGCSLAGRRLERFRRDKGFLSRFCAEGEASDFATQGVGLAGSFCRRWTVTPVAGDFSGRRSLAGDLLLFFFQAFSSLLCLWALRGSSASLGFGAVAGPELCLNLCQLL